MRVVPIQPIAARGLLLVTARPSGAMANIYTYLARGNPALSVTLTAVSCLAAAVATPLVLAIIEAQHGETTGLAVPWAALARQPVLLVVLAVLSGMAIRRCWPDITRRHGRTLLCVGVASLAALLALVVVEGAARFAHTLADLALAAGVLTILAFGAGWATGLASGARHADRLTVGLVFVVRNVGLATAIAVTALGRVEFALFATAYFLIQVLVLLAAAVIFRRCRPGDDRRLIGVDGL